MSEVSSQTLHIVARELAAELNEARAMLEAFGERQDDVSLLTRCGEHLHQVHGALRIVEVYGAALLAEEMEHVVAYLIETFTERRHLPEGLDALMRSMVQLPTYLERVLGGGRDMALVLLPLLNDLRAVRGSALLSEGTLLLLNLTSDQQASPVADPDGGALNIGQWARKLRPRFQVSLLGWIKGERPDQNLEALSRTAERLEQAATTQPVFQLWWVVGAIIEALREKGLEASASAKRLLGQADRELRRLYQIGETAYSESPPVELLNNLLYYVARAKTSGPRVAAVRASFRLGELLPIDEQVSQARESLSAPSVRLMKTVAAAIKEDLARVKDAFDLFVRKGGSQPEELAPHLDMLKKIGDTLGVLGLGGLRDRVQSEIVALQSIVTQRQPLEENALLRIAGTLISIEDGLDEQLVSLIVPAGAEGAPAQVQPTRSAQEDSEFRHVTEAVLRECIVNMARIKEAIALLVERPADAQPVDQIPQLMRGITAGLLMLGKTRAVEVAEGIASALTRYLQSGTRGPSEPLDRLADAIVSVEYYMETIQAGRSDPWYMLDNAETCLRVLADAAARENMGGGAGRIPVTDYAKTIALDRGQQPEPVSTTVVDIGIPTPPAAVAPTPEPSTAMAGGTHAASVGALPPVLAPAQDKADPEFLELFIEEAKDEIQKLAKLFPLWDENPQDQESLVSVRRSFHTLKGSGRMVGALLIGEVAWSIESLLNRVINKTLPRTPEMMALLRQAVATIPELVEQLETGRPPLNDIGRLIAQAKAISGVTEPSRPAVAAVSPMKSPVPLPPADVAAMADEAGEAADVQAPQPASPMDLPAAELVGADLAEADLLEADLLDSTLQDDAAEALLLGQDGASVAAGPGADERGPSIEDPEESGEAPGTELAFTGPIDMPELWSDVAAADDAAAEEFDGPVFGLDSGRAPGAGMDPVLQDIFSKETVAHLAAIREYIAAAAHAAPPYPVTEALHRACHTLSGIAKTAGARQGIKIAEPLNHYIRKLYDGGLGLPTAGLSVLRDASNAIGSVVEHIDENTGFFATHGGIVARIEDLERAADLELANRGDPFQFGESAGDFGDTAVPPALGEDQADVDFAAGTQIGAIDHPMVPDPETAAWLEPFVESAAEDEPVVDEPVVDEPAPPAAALPDTPTADEATVGNDFDADVAAIFAEEAAELLETADTTLDGWRHDAADERHGFEFKRILHTLKGGARMAGLRAMGDLSHELESLLLTIESRGESVGEAVHDVLQASVDELHQMRDAIAQGRQRPASADLMRQIHLLQSGESPAVAEPFQPVPVAQEAVHGEPASAPPVEWMTEAAPESGIGEVEAPVEAAETQPAAEEGSADLLAEAAAEAYMSEGIAGAGVGDEAGADEAGADRAEAQPALPPGREPQPQERHETARVDADLLDNLLNNAGEVSIFRSRLEQQVGSIEFNLAELGRTVTRLKEQLRKLEGETEAQILHRHQEETGGRADFDPLELDRYSTIQQFSRALAESVSDVASIEGLLESLTREAQNLLMQQARTVTELQSGLMRTRMVPFQRHAQRLTRIVRQVATDTGKRAELVVTGGSGELDRQVLERMMPPFEHMLRNAIVHGIEDPEQRAAAGKPETGTISVTLAREGAEIVIAIEDDGRGIDVQAVRDRARARGLLHEGRALTDEEALQLVLEPGFSTASTVTQHAGRGVGMDVVVTEIKKLGGALFTQSTPGKGTKFIVRLPFTLAISQALIVRVTDELYALPLPTIEGVSRVSRDDLLRHLDEAEPTYRYGGQAYRFQHLGAFLGAGPSVIPETDTPLPVVLIRAGEHSTALVTDELVGNREIVVKAVGPQIAGIRGISGATILGDGRIVLILDMGALVRSEWRSRAAIPQRVTEDRRTFALVVDDSITVRRVTQRLLERNGMRVLTAKDGIEALSILQEHVPDIILLDIEMPRMDGYELAGQVRADARLAGIPIVMITSRVGEKHRARAIELGVNDYLGKPYQESQLLDAIDPLVRAYRAQAAS